jgi:hypothetical protein
MLGRNGNKEGQNKQMIVVYDYVLRLDYDTEYDCLDSTLAYSNIYASTVVEIAWQGYTTECSTNCYANPSGDYVWLSVCQNIK